MHVLPGVQRSARAYLPELRWRVTAASSAQGNSGDFLMTHALIENVEAGKLLTRAEAEALMEELLDGSVPTPEIVRLLAAMNTRPAQVAELVGFATAMRRRAIGPFAVDEALPERLVDTCGTGGKVSATFNISTAAAFVTAAAGARIAKHGNRGMSSRSGSVDVLEALSIRVDISMERQARAIRELGIGFLFAQLAHTSMRHAAEARRAIGVRTVFNLLGPLTGPARAKQQVAGVPSAELVDVMAAALLELGTEYALVVHGAGGIDEISPVGETLIAEVRKGSVRRLVVTPEDFGLGRAPLEAISGGSPAENAATIRVILENEPGAKRDVVVMNAAAALVAAGIADNFREGAHLAAAAISSGKAADKLAALVAFTNAA
jgi:anthranilate phosphoribosyltransferase